jgi:phosphoribosyl 1,2-cyclic phosphodiesterase
MSHADDFYIKFWGVRGSIACPGPETVRYGGNTSCAEVGVGSELLVLDGGTGLREFGQRLNKARPPRVDIFFTHVHWDHIAGIPFFAPAYAKDIEVHFWAANLMPERTLKGVLCEQMLEPLFPVPASVFENCHYHDFPCGTPIEPRPGVALNTCRLNHPNRACGYRIDYAGKSICFITDTEHPAEGVDETIAGFVRDADIMVYDAMFTEEEYPRFVSWGHSTWEQAVKLGEAAGVGTVVLFHHDPNHDDDFLDRIGREAEAMRPGTLVAREGLALHP